MGWRKAKREWLKIPETTNEWGTDRWIACTYLHEGPVPQGWTVKLDNTQSATFPELCKPNWGICEHQ